jgi:2-keto-4-pentenoate hydratase/2-oxohepta-3-ene-1,7-dioic acid hydratase in catechol pathway
MTTLPIDLPQKIVCVGLNYHDHAAEGSQKVPERPLLFAKWPNTLIGPREPIVLPAITAKVDYEGELGVIIGREASRVPVDDALEFVSGYVCANDVSARDLQFGDRQWVRGKSLDTFCPMGPALVTADEIDDPQDLAIACAVGEDRLQDARTSAMFFGVAEIISYCSQSFTLEPGDVIATGTPGGVGAFRDSPRFLNDGDRMTVEIERIGRLENTCRVASAQAVA